MDVNSRQQIIDKISKSQNILVAASQESGFDALASSLALYLSIKKLGKNVSVTAREPTVNDAKSLYAVDKIRKSESQNNLIITVNNAVDNVDKVTYSLEGSVLKIIVHALPNSSGIQKEDLGVDKLDSTPDTIIALGFNSAESLRSEITQEHNISSSAHIISINVNETSQKIAQLELNDPNTSSISEIVTNLIKDLRMPINEDIAFNLYSGIKWATKMFEPKDVKPSTFSAAQYLIELGAGKSNLAVGTQSFPSTDRGRSSLTNPPTQGFASRDVQFKSELKPNKVPEFISQNSTNPSQSKVTGTKLYSDKVETPLEDVEVEKKAKQSWLKPPKVYRGSKSFDRES